MCEYTDECVCHQAAGPSRPLSTAISQSPGCLQSWGDASVFLVQAGSVFSFLLPVWKNQNPRARSELPRRGDLPPTILSLANPGLAFLQQPCPTSPAKVQGSLELGLETSCEAESWDVRHGCCQAEHGLWHVQVLNSFSIPSRTRR